MRLTLSLLNRAYPKSSFRRPMQGRGIGKKKPVIHWSLSLGELDEEKEVHGRTVPARDRVPLIMVPDLEDFDLKPYMTYRAESTTEPPMEAKDFFNIFYAPGIEAKYNEVHLENIPEQDCLPKKHRMDGDPFDSLSVIESKVLAEGYVMGFAAGQKIGYTEGLSLGKSKGEILANELGSYYGFCLCAMHNFSNRTQTMRSYDKLKKLLCSFIKDVEIVLNKKQFNLPAVYDEMVEFRSKFKNIQSLLCIKLDDKSVPVSMSF